MKSDVETNAEVRALTELGLREVGVAAGGIHKVHRAVSDRVFAGVRLGTGAAVTPIKAIHDGITDGVYQSIEIASAAASELAGKAMPSKRSWSAPSETVRGAAAIGIINGLIGDRLEADESPLAQDPMTIRVGGRVVSPDRTQLRRAFPAATGRIVIFLHGLVETEYSWRLGGASTYGDRLADDLGVTPIAIRYNTGRHISANGRALSYLVAATVRNWPVPVTDVTLVGHSMGGLVARSAAFHGARAGMEWTTVTSLTVSLGTPHHGAPLEQLAHVGSALLTKMPETAPFGRLLRRRSAGIRDLRHGSLVDQDWRGRDADSLAKVATTEVPLLAGATHCFVSASVATSRLNPLGYLIGDGLVLTRSASGRSGTRRVGFGDGSGFHLPGAHHMSLLNNDAVYEQLRTWVATAGRLPEIPVPVPALSES
ncbi:alpha/beta fold hydrolase [Gordonia sp. TBRC 11910]|uniref:Alpha/beta fold hydrolase n=1 Tax=Gordonia asplenii TaxID=2725283 RepID=A0A848KSG5_9ACTN|nr:alpha/beta fold hydrolase [Gordonia asplenii]NMO01904.1 alpha/beta fold hydrolase [Gordonia asplenii]